MLPLHHRLLALGLCAITVGFPVSMNAQTAPSNTSERAANAQPGQETSLEALPDSPGATLAKSQESTQQNPSAQPDSPSTDSQHEHDEKLQRPVGTAAAEAPRVSGITAAQPAGAAIAPAKQRRVRTLVLKVGAILGASAAIGTVIALSAATPSKPPGAH